jgi:hypothetical protein
MTSRFLPYATTPARLTAQVVSDLLVATWITAWVLVGLAVHHAIAAQAAPDRLAQELGLPYLDTGLLYRAVGRRVLDAGGDPRDAVVAECAARTLTPADLDRGD